MDLQAHDAQTRDYSLRAAILEPLPVSRYDDVAPHGGKALVSQHRVGFSHSWGMGVTHHPVFANHRPLLIQMTSSTGYSPIPRPLPARPFLPFYMYNDAMTTTTATPEYQALWLLNDYPPGTRPIYSYHTLIRAALLTTPRQSPTANQIVQAIEDKFPYFKTERGQPCRYYILNALSNTPCFVPNGRGPIPDELYWTYNPNLDGQRVTSMLSSVSSPSTTSTLVNALCQPKEDDKDDNWNELNLGSISDHQHHDTVECVGTTEERRDPDRRIIKRQREARTEEWARRTRGVNRMASHGTEEKQDIVSRAERLLPKRTKEQPLHPRSDPTDPTPSKRPKKDGEWHDQGCCILM